MNSNDPRIANLSIVSASTEYSYKFSAAISKIQIQARGANALKMAFQPFVAASGAYQTIKNGGVYSEINLRTKPKYYFSGTGGDTVEILFWY